MNGDPSEDPTPRWRYAGLKPIIAISFAANIINKFLYNALQSPRYFQSTFKLNSC